MADASIKQSGGDFTSISAFVGDAGTSATDTGTIGGTWSVDDTAKVTWNKAVVIVADADSQQIGRPFQSGDTHYRLRPTGSAGTDYVFTVTAEVDITGIDVQSEFTGASAELFRAAGANGGTITNCMLGFTGNTTEQDVWYTVENSTKTLTFEQCFFYDVGRSIVDMFGGGESGTFTINFNTCSSFNIGANGGRENGAWFGQGSGSSGDTVNINAHNSLITSADTYAFSIDTTSPQMNVDCTYSISDIATTAISNNENSEVLTGTVGNRTWRTSSSGGDEVLMTNITSGTYDPALVDHANNDAQAFHAVVTDAGLTIPDLDILGQTRDKTTPSFDCGPSALTLAAGGGLSIPVAYHHQRMLTR